MKKFRKIAAVAIAAVMVFSFAACGSKDDGVVADTVKEFEKLAEEEVTLEGTWESEPINTIDYLAEGADEEMKTQLGSDISIKDYLTEFKMKCVLTFNEEKKFELRYEVDSDRNQLRKELEDYIRDVFNEYVGEELSDEELQESLGMSIEDYAAEAWDEAMEELLPENMVAGSYTFEHNTIVLTDDESGELYIGKLDGKVLTMTDETEGDIVFTKVSKETSFINKTSSSLAPTGNGKKASTNNTPSNTATTGEKNALSKANSYLNFSAFSYEGLIEQLEYEGFTHSEAVYAVDNCGADWNQQALKKAKSYLEYTAFSYTGLIEQLEYEGFTHSQAEYGVNNCNADWNQQAALKAESYLKYSSFSRQSLIDQLEYEGFTYEQAVYGVGQNGY